MHFHDLFLESWFERGKFYHNCTIAGSSFSFISCYFLLLISHLPYLNGVHAHPYYRVSHKKVNLFISAPYKAQQSFSTWNHHLYITFLKHNVWVFWDMKLSIKYPTISIFYAPNFDVTHIYLSIGNIINPWLLMYSFNLWRSKLSLFLQWILSWHKLTWTLNWYVS